MLDTWRGRFVWGLSLLVIAPALLAGCGEGYRVFRSGKVVQYSEWRDFKTGERLLGFAGDDKPETVLMRRRLMDNLVTQEHIKLAPETPHRSFIHLSYLPYGVIYTAETARRLHDKKVLLKNTEGYFRGRTVSEAKERRNGAGKYLYASADFGTGITCVYARQGFETHSFTKSRSEAHYEAILTFLHCSPKPEREIIALFDSIRVRGSARRSTDTSPVKASEDNDMHGGLGNLK